MNHTIVMNNSMIILTISDTSALAEDMSTVVILLL